MDSKKVLGFFSALLLSCGGVYGISQNAGFMNVVTSISASVLMGEKVQAENVAPLTQNKSSSEKPGVIFYKNALAIKSQKAAQKKKTTNAKSVKSLEFPSEQPEDWVLNVLPYPYKMQNHDGVISDFTYPKYTDNIYFNLDDGGQVKNCTSLSNDVLYKQSQKSPDFSLKKNSKKPQILIYHTHTTESFETESRKYYDTTFNAKSTDESMNTVAIGNKICEQFDKAGIAYVHDTLVHDYPSYDDAYDSSRSTVQAILKKYPSIKICLDIHRDGIEREDGTRIAPVTDIGGKKAAQIMIISGCDDGTLGMPNYMKNFSFACKLQSQIESDWQGLTRPIMFDYRFYNQDLTTGSLLIEVGSHGNSIGQVKYSGELIGKSIAKMFG